jgi:hypothetical protein
LKKLKGLKGVEEVEKIEYSFEERVQLRREGQGDVLKLA